MMSIIMKLTDLDEQSLVLSAYINQCILYDNDLNKNTTAKLS